MGVVSKDPMMQLSPSTNDAGIKGKYLNALQVHVVEPMRRELLEMQAQQADGEVDRALRVLDAEIERAMNLRLSDYDVPAPVVGQAAERVAR